MEPMQIMSVLEETLIQLVPVKSVEIMNSKIILLLDVTTVGEIMVTDATQTAKSKMTISAQALRQPAQNVGMGFL